jgi:AraC-like DNA-binding protein
MKAMFLTTSILQSLLREKMMIWNDMMYVHHNHVITLDDEDVDNYSQFYDMLRSAVERGNKKPFRKEVVQSLLKVALLALCGEMKLMLPEDNLSEETKLSNSHFQRFLEVLHNSEVKYHTVEYYASELCISPKHLTSICKRISGKTANEWIREQVIEDIRYYLKKTDLSIKQVGNRVGFSNTSFFGKYVKQHLGMTPMEYRNS